MITLYKMHSDSPSIRKITVMLAETGLPYDIRVIAKQDDGKFPAEYLAINPNGTVPSIEDSENGVVLFESGAILYYLAEKTGKLLPDALDARAEVMKWLLFEAANVNSAILELYHYLVKATDTVPDTVLQRYQAKLMHYCALLEQQLEGREYLCGSFSIADIALYSLSMVLEDMADIQLSDYPNMNRWINTINQRPAVQAAVRAGKT